MATNNATNTSNPITVAQGGTGAVTQTVHGVLLGQTTSAITATAAGTNGQLLCGSTGADPQFTTLASAAGTITYTTGAHTLDVAVTQPLRLSSQPAFLAYLASSANNVTGDATAYQIVFDTAQYDQASNYNTSTGLFTAPVTGIYLFTANVVLTGLGASHTLINGSFVGAGTTALVVRQALLNPAPIRTSGNFCCTYSAQMKMTASDTCYAQIIVSGSTKTVNVNGGNTSGGSFFAATMIA